MSGRRRINLIAIALIVIAAPFTAMAHPLLQGSLDVTIAPSEVLIRARVTLEEVIVSDTINPEPRPTTKPANALDELANRHARYLAQHLSMSADGKLLSGRVVNVSTASQNPPTISAATTRAAADPQHVVVQLAYALPVERPKSIQIWQDVFGTPDVSLGNGWQVSYVTNIAVPRGPVTQGLLLTTAGPIVCECDWNVLSPTTAPANQTAPDASNKSRLFRDYLAHGVRHILTGYDHLLFISALVLAAVSLWDLVKVVTAFTLAHTITLTLAALRIVHLPGWVVEPMIAASIVFVAAQNVFWPRHARGWGRLAIAFGFGLFHGLGFAGGLLDAMSEMAGLTIFLAILAFSIGVELGHQIVVIPLFTALKLLRRFRTEPAERDRVSHLALRYGSAAICIAGAYYLFAAITSAIAISGHL